MKKFTLLMFVLALAGIVNAQVAITGVPTPVKDGPAYGTKVVNPEKGGGDVFWSTTFDWGTGEDTTSWSLPDGWLIVDNTDYGNPWMWRSPYDTLGGCCTWQGPSPNFITPMDGYIVLPADEYNRRDGVGTSFAMDSYFQTPSIDCSAKSSVVVKFSQLFRLCCGSNTLKMMVTNDDGVHWAEYDCLFGLPNNRVCDLRYRNVEFNISDVAAGMPNVQIRFYQTGNSHYYWMIDDLRLEEAYQNEAVLVDYWLDVNGGFDSRVGHINYFPKSQYGLESPVSGHIGDYESRGAVLNNGMADQENMQLQMTVLKNGEQVYQDVSDGITLWPLDRDTLTVNSVFLADDYGDYQMSFDVISDNVEEVPANNSKIQMFTVTDSLYHRADFTPEASSNTGGWVGGSNAGDMVGVFYDLYAPAEIKSITAYIAGVTVSQSPTFQYVLQKYLPDEDIIVEWITSDIYEADSTHRNSWQTRDMELDGETEFLEPGEYIACVRFWGDDGTEEGSNGMSIGWDMDNRAAGYTYNYQAVSDGWFNTNKMNLIGMVLNEKGGPTEAPVTFNVDMNKHIANGEFHPGTDFMDVSGTFNGWTGSEHMTDADGDGIYTLTIGAQPIASVMEYKYRINGNWDTSEFPMGGPNRKATIRYWNVLNNVYNGGVTTGVEDIALIDNLTVFPNPTQGDITVQFSTTQTADIAISLMDIQGHVVYTKQINGVVNHTETIENNFAKGVYFLTVNNGKEVKVQKVVIQ